MVAINVTRARIPVVFELNDDSDNRFKKVKVWIAHTGENLNNSYFSKETLEEMAKTLPKIPIVGYIEADSEGEDDFSDHRQEIVVKSGEGVDIRYKGHAYGFIPEDSKAAFELRDGKEWLTAEGYIWTKFRDAMEIFSSENGVKSQSMEIAEAEGEVDDIGRMVISSAVFSALCILGEEVPPAMTGSTVEFFNEKNQYQLEFDQMLEEFEKEKGELDLSKENEDLTKEDLDLDGKEGENPEEPEVKEEPETTEEPEASEEPETTEEPESDDTPEDGDEPEGDETDEGDEPEDDGEATFSIEDGKVSLSFQLSHEDKRRELYEKLNEHSGYSYIIAMYDDHAIVEHSSYNENDEYTEKFLRVDYTSGDDSVELGEATEIFPMFLTEGERDDVLSQREEIETLNSRLEELTSYKASIELSEKESLVSKHEDTIGEEAVEKIRDKFSEMTVEDVEKEVAFQFYKQVKENGEDISKKASSAQVHNFNKPKENRYGELDKYFN